MEPAAKLFVAAFCSAALGGLFFLPALGMAFTPGENGEVLMMLSIALVGFGAIANVITSVWGLVIFLAEYRIRWWWLPSLIASASTAWFISFLLSL